MPKIEEGYYSINASFEVEDGGRTHAYIDLESSLEINILILASIIQPLSVEFSMPKEQILGTLIFVSDKMDGITEQILKVGEGPCGN